ncbi:hypothetical protein CIW52_03240 [Mycolicibacterium sp. P9-64]|uniref:hypothetical protein n=1 Tax=Mycolicibacterium sp. P9-64 TaxID=2024612 RepID=UPI0011EC3FCF|nr:hypothetical protein [Mycolicibacterium sp. P9-64]KAA0086913.1 hypothetical protein CIW52_03240 [Mycolicibacterium sp. P9-64]
MSEPTTGAPNDVPEDVVTGFWLWVAALPLLVTGYVVDLVTGPAKAQSWFVSAISGVFVFIVAAVVLTFLILMRHGYRWTRTLLTGGGATTIVVVAVGLFAAGRPEAAALVYAATGIVGSVLIAGGMYLLHRQDAHAFFTK